jgi:hypothetical protein
MPPTPEEAAKDLEEGQLDFYRELYEEGDMSGAQQKKQKMLLELHHQFNNLYFNKEEHLVWILTQM